MNGKTTNEHPDNFVALEYSRGGSRIRLLLWTEATTLPVLAGASKV